MAKTDNRFPPCTVRTLQGSELDWANAQYAEADFMQSGAEDLILVAEVGEQKAGLGRLVTVDSNAAEMGGIYVMPEFRGENVARAIVQALIAASTYGVLYCIPFARLRDFYASFGFVDASAEARIPDTVAAKVAWCSERYPDPVALLMLKRLSRH